MSGGVDSSVTARLLVEKDFDLSAVFMRNWDTRDENASSTGCEWERDWEDVQRVCRTMSLPVEMVDLSQQYWTRVFEPAIDEWREGSTPNPDVSCNREIKFGALMDRILTSENQWLATGHYAQLGWDTQWPSPRPQLLRSFDAYKDQTYYLSSVKEARLRQALFPIGHLTKQDVRSLARKYDLPTASRAESMGICFVGERGRFDHFLAQYIPPSPGDIVDVNGKILGQHSGLYAFTVGQGARLRGMKSKMFVARKDVLNNRIIVVDRGDHPMLMCTSLILQDCQWIWEDHPPPPVDTPDGHHVLVQIRHRMTPVAASLCRKGDHDRFLLKFDSPQHAVSPGQIAGIWDGDWCLGCGRIEQTTCLA